MRRIISGIILLFIPYIVLSKDFNLKKELIGEKNSDMVSIGEVQSNSFDYRKPLIFNKSEDDTSFLGLLEIKETESDDNKTDIVKEPGSRIRLFVGSPFGIQYVHSSGFGISMNNINPKITQNGTKNYPEANAIAVSYTFLYDNYSFGLGLSSFETKGKISGCPSDDLCYNGDRDVNNGSLIQIITSYNLFENYELNIGLNSIYFRLDKYSHPSNSDGDLGATFYSKNLFNFGLGYIF